MSAINSVAAPALSTRHTYVPVQRIKGKRKVSPVDRLGYAVPHVVDGWPQSVTPRVGVCFRKANARPLPHVLNESCKYPIHLSRQCQCGGVIREHQLTGGRVAWTCSGCGRYEIFPAKQGETLWKSSAAKKSRLAPGGMLPTNTELANLAAACNQRLSQRLQYQESKKVTV